MVSRKALSVILLGSVVGIGGGGYASYQKRLADNKAVSPHEFNDAQSEALKKGK